MTDDNDISKTPLEEIAPPLDDVDIAALGARLREMRGPAYGREVKLLAEIDDLKRQIELLVNEKHAALQQRDREREEAKRFNHKAGSQKDIIREMRSAMRQTIITVRNLADRKPNEVTAAHLTDLRHEVDQLVMFTDLPR